MKKVIGLGILIAFLVSASLAGAADRNRDVLAQTWALQYAAELKADKAMNDAAKSLQDSLKTPAKAAKAKKAKK